MAALKDIYESCTACTHSKQVHTTHEAGIAKCRAYQCHCETFATDKTAARTAMIPTRGAPDMANEEAFEAMLDGATAAA